MKLGFILTSLIFLSSCATYHGKEKFKRFPDISYNGKNDQRHLSEVLIPEGKGPFPGVVVVHGGGWRSRKYSDMNSIAESLASHGFVVININYRFSPKFRHPAPIEDLQEALLFFKQKASDYKLDINKIGLWGYSSGGHTVSYYGITRNHLENLKVQAIVSGGAPYDFTWYPKSPYIRGYLGKYRNQMLKEYFEASPSNLVIEGLPPFFLYHAEGDTLVELAQATSFEAKLRAKNVKVKRYDIPFWGHVSGFILSDEAVKRGILFLEKELKH